MTIRQAVVDRFIGDMARDLDADHAQPVNLAYADAVRRTDAAFEALEACLAAPIRRQANRWPIDRSYRGGRSVKVALYIAGRIHQPPKMSIGESGKAFGRLRHMLDERTKTGRWIAMAMVVVVGVLFWTAVFAAVRS